MIEKITLDGLTQDSVSLKKQNYVEVEGELQFVGQPWRRAYVNSEQGRAQIVAEIPEPYKSAVFAVWGDVPTIFPVED
jgi:hypothetical protein